MAQQYSGRCLGDVGMAQKSNYSVFILMAFDEKFDDVYEAFIKPLFEESKAESFNVDRADDIHNQQNIMQDIVTRIAQSHLIVADLTDNNPNVFYELGVAHTLGRPVILLAQNMDDVPFDLRAYRVLIYDTHFTKIAAAREELGRYIEAFVNGTLQFGNPVSDHLAASPDVPSIPSEPANGAGASEDDRGFLDHIETTNNGFTTLTTIAEDMTAAMEQDVTKPLAVANEAIARFNNRPGGPIPADMQAVMKESRRLAGHLNAFTARLSTANAEYAVVAADMEHSLEFVADVAVAQEGANDAEIEEHFDSLRTFQSTAKELRGIMEGLAQQQEGLPNIERRLNRALREQSAEIRIFCTHLDKSIASVARALHTWDNRPKS